MVSEPKHDDWNESIYYRTLNYKALCACEEEDLHKLKENEDLIKNSAKSIENTPVLKGGDLINFVASLGRKDSAESKQRRKSALSFLSRVKR